MSTSNRIASQKSNLLSQLASPWCIYQVFRFAETEVLFSKLSDKKRALFSRRSFVCVKLDLNASVSSFLKNFAGDIEFRHRSSVHRITRRSVLNNLTYLRDADASVLLSSQNICIIHHENKSTYNSNTVFPPLPSLATRGLTLSHIPPGPHTTATTFPYPSCASLLNNDSISNRCQITTSFPAISFKGHPSHDNVTPVVPVVPPISSTS